MSEDKGKDELFGGSGQDNTIQNSEETIYELTSIAANTLSQIAVLGAFKVGKSTMINKLISKSGEHSRKEIQIMGVDNSELENESEYSAEIDEIFTQLHEADDDIAETRQNTVQLGIETRSMLNDLRKQLG